MRQPDLSFPVAPASLGSDHDWELYATWWKILHMKMELDGDLRLHGQTFEGLAGTLIRLPGNRNNREPLVLALLVHRLYPIYPACVESIFKGSPRPTPREFLQQVTTHVELQKAPRSYNNPHPQPAPLPIGRSGREVCRWCYEGTPSVVAD